ncbi:uncharacterized protein EAF01_010606 [Botrytis porri]|uniref:Uncharacterized protein n=1 Tax=Botrytis porri TaxID=87229 RepID=A0A4Z1KQD9_9HELO|nr:uncharacterized protein EAF01_010606 [Botrytis porri]KAF7890797.1 hypothetical protein EAF01_010606 [Botrytis porri]TGO86064.1 hypothetical protein BPOR_0338g00010 [Botrytis porri]
MNDSDSDDSENANLKKENEELRRELKASTLHLATLAHKEYQVPDGSIREDYQKICRAFETWIDYASSNESGDFRSDFRDALQSEEKTHALRAIGIEYQPPAASDPKLDYLKSLDMLHYFILSLLIGKYVFNEILRRKYPVGVTESQEDTLLGIEKEMIKMGKAKSKISQWKADSLTALCASREYKDEQSKEISHLQNDLEEEMSFWCDFGDSSRSKARLRSEILEPAVKLHLEMQCSTQSYEIFDEPRRSSSKGEYSQDLVKEISTWKTMTSDGTEDVFQCVYPGVMVQSMETEDESVLVEPIMAVYKKNFWPQAKRSTTSSSMKSSSRVDNSMKGPRNSKHQKISTSASKNLIGYFRNPFTGSSGRKSGDDRQSPERKSPRRRRSLESSSSRPNRRASRDTSSKQVQIISSGHDQTISYQDLSQPLQDWKMAVHGSSTTYTRVLTANPHENNEYFVEVEPEEMYTASPEQSSVAYYGRASVPDEA